MPSFSIVGRSSTSTSTPSGLEIAQPLREAFRVKNVRRLADEIAREEHALDNRRVLFRARARSGGAFDGDLARFQRRLLSGFSLVR